jgi:hypothetical protein
MKMRLLMGLLFTAGVAVATVAILNRTDQGRKLLHSSTI